MLISSMLSSKCVILIFWILVSNISSIFSREIEVKEFSFEKFLDK